MPQLQVSEISNLLTSLISHFNEPSLQTAHAFCHFEEQIHAIFRHLADLFVAAVLTYLLKHTSFEKTVLSAKKKSSNRLKNKGKTSRTVRLLGGLLLKLDLTILSFRPKKKGPRKRKRGSGCGHRFTPVLQVLGFAEHCSPATWHSVLLSCTANESFESAQRNLARCGISLSKKKIHKMFERLGGRMLKARLHWLESSHSAEKSAAGRRLVIQMDGGRCRQRIFKAGRKKLNGYRGFDAPWVEPRIFVMYVIDENGNYDKSWGKVSDGEISQGSDFMKLFESYLVKYEANKASEIIVVADGQPWQWTHMNKMLKRIGADMSQVTEVLDKIHAKQRIYEIARLENGELNGHIVYNCMKFLEKGDISNIYEYCTSLKMKGKRKKLKSLAGYFKTHETRMKYNEYAEKKQPCGSGMIESMIRQVINMRVKSCGKFWKKENAQVMICARSGLKTRRFEILIDLIQQDKLGWLNPPDLQYSCAQAA